MALNIQYQFHDEEEDEKHTDGDYRPNVKKSKTDIKNNTNVLKYSRIKLPAAMFGIYLENDCTNFLNDCLR